MTSDVDAPDELDFNNLDQYSEAEIEAYNEQKERELDERMAALAESKQAAANALRQDASDTVATETVTLPGGNVDIDVRTRIPPSVEDKQERLTELYRNGGDLQRMRELNAEMLAEMVEDDDYGDPEVWLLASRDGDAGMQWLSEVTATILEPARSRAEATQGKLQGSGSSQSRQKDKPSGWQRQR